MPSTLTGTSKAKRVLVLGDWFVDENWIVTGEDVPTSSHRGIEQYRSRVDSISAQLFSLCGAGGVLRLLHCLSGLRNAPRTDLHGIGCWEPGDTKHLAALVRPDRHVTFQTPHTLTGMVKTVPLPDRGRATKAGALCQEPSGECLGHCAYSKTNPRECNRLASLAKEGDGTGTWRVIRVYSQTGDRVPKLLQRVDWELLENPSKDIRKTMAEQLQLRLAAWHEHKVVFDAVVLADHRGYVVNNEVVECLTKHPATANARWYARTKHPNAKWLLGLGNRLRLVVFGPVGLESVLKSDPWSYGPHVSREAAEWLETKSKQLSEASKSASDGSDAAPFHSAVFAFHDDNTLQAVIPEHLFEPLSDDDSRECPVNKGPVLLTTTEHPEPTAFKVGRTSVLFTYLVAVLEGLLPAGRTHGTRDRLTSTDVADALNHTDRWCHENAKHVTQELYKQATSLDFRESYATVFRQRPTPGKFHVGASALGNVKSRWDQARQPDRLGIIPDPTEQVMVPKDKFQIWRGWSAVGKFIALDGRRREALVEMVRFVRQFAEDRQPRRSKSAFILGSPGWGKSFLAEQLAATQNLSFHEFNITHLRDVEDLLNCFDTISSIQTRQTAKPLLVFWDEINAPLDHGNVYSYFLGPLWDGVYRRGGQTFQLRPCLWVFAGTRLPGARTPAQATGANSGLGRSSHAALSDEPKGSDFLSRLNGPIIQLRDRHKPGESLCELDALEQVYMSMAVLRREHPDVSVVSRAVLEFFSEIRPTFGIRSIEFIISRFRSISHGRVDERNLPDALEIYKWLEGSEEVDAAERAAAMIGSIRARYKDTGPQLVRLYDSVPKLRS